MESGDLMQVQHSSSLMRQCLKTPVWVCSSDVTGHNISMNTEITPHSHHIGQTGITSNLKEKNISHQLPSCDSDLEISEISDGYDVSQKELQKCQQTVGEMAAKPPSLAAACK